MKLLPEEKETHISITNGETDWHVYTCQKAVMTKIEKAGIVASKEEFDSDGDLMGKHYNIPFARITFAKERKKPVISDEVRESRRRNIQKILENKDK